MENAEGYMSIELPRRAPPPPSKEQGSHSKCWKITLGVLLVGSIVLNVGLITLVLAAVTLDPDTANRRIVISPYRKSARWGETEQNLPNNTKRFDRRVWVLGQQGFNSGKHCWEVEVKGDGEWAVGVAKESVKRKGETDFSTNASIWGVGAYGGKGNYVAFTSPHTRLSFDKKPRRIRVFLDYTQGLVDFFNAETKLSFYTFQSASFSGEMIYPWFRVWVGTELTLHP